MMTNEYKIFRTRRGVKAWAEAVKQETGINLFYISRESDHWKRGGIEWVLEIPGIYVEVVSKILPSQTYVCQ